MNKHLDACLLKQARREEQEQLEQQKRREQQEQLDQQQLREVLEKSRLPLSSENHCENLKQKNDDDDSQKTVPIPVEAMPPDPVPTIIDTTPAETMMKEADQSPIDDEPDQPKSPTNLETKTDVDKEDQEQSNAFAHMMKRSATVFSEQEVSVPKLYERMHLHEDGRVTLTCYSGEHHRSLQPDSAWSASIQVRGTKDGTRSPIDLLVTCDVPSFSNNSGEPERFRLVKRHSRLSVPVLKSILQKGIRRRKPLPSVRVASELADKSLGDLLRRLPIIVLEDSTLHPGLPFLVWLMIAVSKDYQPSLGFLKKMLGIVFEMASCRWQDSLPKKKTVNGQDQHPVLSLASLHKTAISNLYNRKIIEGNPKEGEEEAVLNDNDLIVWSILLRAQYGGMAGDIKMLQGYAELWHTRFHATQGIPDKIKKRLSPTSSGCSTAHSAVASPSETTVEEKASGEDHCLQDWYQVPGFIHESANKHSESRVDRLLMANPQSPLQSKTAESRPFVGLVSLTKLDLTPEGVDFHCSSVLESAILSDAQLVRESFVKLVNSSNIQLPVSIQDRRSWLEGLLKSCMWKYGGGVNFRMPMVGTKSTNGGDEERDLKEFYETLIRPRLDAFSRRYIDERLSR